MPENFVGEIFVDWKSCLDNPEKWNFHYQYSMNNITFGDKEDPIEVGGEISVQGKWVPSTSSN